MSSLQEETAARLRLAREAAGYATAADAATAIGIKQPTFTHHENGTRGITKSAERYAAFFRVSLDWLMTGRGPMKTSLSAIPVVGLVGAGAGIYPVPEDATSQPIDEIDMPDPQFLGALEVRGDSQYPRYNDGEFVLYDTRVKPPGSLVGHFAVVDLADGRRLLKILRRMPEPGRFRLESHNAPPEDDAAIEAAYAVVGALTPARWPMRRVR